MGENTTRIGRANFRAAILAATSESPFNQDTAAKFWNPSTDVARFVIGRNQQSADIARLVKLDGVVDDYQKSSEPWNNVPVIASCDIPRDAIVANCSTSISPVATYLHLQSLRSCSIVNVNELIHASDGKMNQPWFVKQQLEDYARYSLEWKNLFDRLADDESKRTLLDVLRYRLTSNMRYMWDYSVRISEQYFESFMNFHEETFIDAGGYDGDTTQEFIRRFPNYKKIYFFEPSDTNLRAARQRLAGVRDIEFMPLGLSDSEGELRFDAAAGSASSVSESGNQTIRVAALDDAVTVPVTFIKMDLEGWEMKALAGCRNHIARNKPKLAISVYHAASDFRCIPQFVLSMNPEYQVYLRHYTQGWSETVMFFR